jgi:hypothetical protein
MASKTDGNVAALAKLDKVLLIRRWQGIPASRGREPPSLSAGTHKKRVPTSGTLTSKSVRVNRSGMSELTAESVRAHGQVG